MHKSLLIILLIFLTLFTGCMSSVNKATLEGDLPKLKRLIEIEDHEISPHEIIPTLHLAVSSGNLEIVKYLVAQGADVNIDSNVLYSPTALHIAAHIGNINIVKYLISQGAKVKRDERWWSSSYHKVPQPLHRAAINGHVEVVKYLCNQGAEINAKNHHGKTALHHAAFDGHIKLVQFLVEHGASITIKDRWGNTPLDLAKRYRFFWGDIGVVNYLNSKVTDQNNE